MSLVDAVSPMVMRGGLVVVPVGSTEQHGPHLPLDTDTVIAAAVATELAPLLGGVVAPPLAYGASGEHQSFAGTISIGSEVLTAVLVELGRSLSTWAAEVVLVNGHGGNLTAVRRAVEILRHEERLVRWTPCAVAGGDAHAGRTETSLMLHLDPARVRWREAVCGNTGPLTDLLPLMRADGVAAVSPNGVLGDPRQASASEGRQLLTDMVSAAYHRLQTAVAR